MDFKNKIILAPMVDVTDIAFRKVCTDHGADIVYSQMIDAVAFDRGARKLADFYDEKNVVAQFFGNDAKLIAKGAKAVEDKVIVVDLNLGCPRSNVVERKCGSYLMRYPSKIKAIIKELVKKVKVPVSVKIRAGYDKNNINAVKIAKLCEKEGVSAIAVHGRARTVNYAFPVDYDIIKKVKESVNIPVIGNGDIFNGEDAKRMFDNTKCDSVMVARGAIGNPAVFSQIKDYLDGKKEKMVSIVPNSSSTSEQSSELLKQSLRKARTKKKLFYEYLRYAKKYKIHFKSIRTQAQWFTKGVKHGGEYRGMINSAETVDELKEVYELIG